MSNRFLTEQFFAWRSAGESLVLATVCETAGSTYSKAGRQLLINREHNYVGLVGGGCLEGDLVLRADEVFADGVTQIVTYDMRDEADDMWGMGLGCRGMMKLLLQRLDQANNWEPFATLAQRMQDAQPCTVALTTASNKIRAAGQLVDPCNEPDVVQWTVRPWPRLLILGAGPDAAPIVTLARALGWHIEIADHRDELLQHPRFSEADARHTVNPATIANDVALKTFNAVCVMSHHLASDCLYLKALRDCDPVYVGVLGPGARKQQLLEKLGEHDTAFARRLRGPIGLDIGADTPQSIALALLAEIHATLKHEEKPAHEQ